MLCMDFPTYAAAVAAEVRAEMGRKQVTATHLATRTDIPSATLSRRLNGRSAFTVEELHRISAVLGVPVSVLVPDSASAGAA